MQQPFQITRAAISSQQSINTLREKVPENIQKNFPDCKSENENILIKRN
jgi:hypothetical protein